MQKVMLLVLRMTFEPGRMETTNCSDSRDFSLARLARVLPHNSLGEYMVADGMTKPLPREAFERHRAGMGITAWTGKCE